MVITLFDLIWKINKKQLKKRPIPYVKMFLFFSSFFRAHAIEEALRKDRYSAEKGTESTKKGEGEQQHKEKTQPSPI